MIAGRRWQLAAALSLTSLLLAACGSQNDRRPMRGRVEVDGVAVPRGSIGFRPVAGNSGPAANAGIVDGAYRFTEETGPHAGPHRVVIQIEPPAGGEQGSGAGASRDRKAAGVGTRPPRARAAGGPAARRHWELPYTVPAGGDYRKDFELEG